MLPDDTRIAGTKTVKDWKDIKVRLKGCNDPAVWDEAFKNFFEARLDSRYFEPVRAIEKMNQDCGEGFAIVAIHCSLIEFLSATLEGKNYRYQKDGKPPLGGNEYSDSRDMFVQFLRNRNPFRRMFTTKSQAKDFYKSVRCGLLHEARTKGIWKIRVSNAPREAIDAAGKVVYRNKMQAAFDEFMICYKKQLAVDADLQQSFIRKFDALCSE